MTDDKTLDAIERSLRRLTSGAFDRSLPDRAADAIVALRAEIARLSARIAWAEQLPTEEWASIGAEIVGCLAEISRAGNPTLAKRLLAAVDRGKTYTAKLEGRLSAPVSSEIEAMAEKLDSLSYRFRRSGEDDDIAAPSATLLRALDRERQDFHMTYRMKCDAETKALQSDLSRYIERDSAHMAKIDLLVKDLEISDLALVSCNVELRSTRKSLVAMHRRAEIAEAAFTSLRAEVARLRAARFTVAEVKSPDR